MVLRLTVYGRPFNAVRLVLCLNSGSASLKFNEKVTIGYVCFLC